MSTPDPDSEHRDNYDAEKTVDLRRQRLRRQSPPELHPATIDDSAPSVDDQNDDVFADPYEVGQDALAANEEPLTDVPAEYVGRGFDTGYTDTDSSPAEWGLRGRINAALGLKRAPVPDSAEDRFRQSVRRVQQPLPGCMVVSVVSLKGDAGKTSTTTALSNTFGLHRGRGVVAWDANESTGTLGHRAERTTDPELGPWDILENAHALASSDAVSGALGHYLRLQPTHDEVLAADGSTSRERGIGWDECAALMAVLRRHRDLIFIDTGNNALASNWQWAVQHSDLLVIPLPLRRDMAIQALAMLDGIAARGYEHLVRSAVVLTVLTPGSDPALEDTIVAEFGQLGVTTIMRVPYEPVFASGQRIKYRELAPATVEAYTNVAAEIADALAMAAYERTAQYADTYAPQEFTRPSQAVRRAVRRPPSGLPRRWNDDAHPDLEQYPPLPPQQPHEQWRPRTVPPHTSSPQR